MASILIVDDHPALRLALRTQLSQLLGVTTLLEADNGQGALNLVRQHRPDLVLLDLDIPRMSGLDAVPRIRALHPAVRILVLSAQDPIPFAARAYHAGAQGFVSKTQNMDAILRCVESVLGGFTVFPNNNPRDNPRESRVVGDSEGLSKLTDKEVEILRMLTRGMSNKAIGKALFISNKTVSSYKTRVMKKLAADSLVDLIDFARRCRLIP
ncbi:two-component system, NarL family, response regulator EvgA [Cupriavidus metallidurans]|jgi:two-component system, NarL family, response regulator EvgA|nr:MULTISPECIES: response regulator transcription factor [Cupriavidus]HBO82022.1 DNA-binding response regulator [Cupriavidus sp.]AVA35450.1 DNA-binding response regulator [Cupriavidus metallidurans]EKZ98987.1 LuxR family transcriptional regulator [Cupriavidus sp. HMR-1]KWR76887.1 two-component system response regulator [Cupriavidus sp. SHE]KWW33242.1 putative transcriptional regulator [Cupriavidus metallidurans]